MLTLLRRPPRHALTLCVPEGMLADPDLVEELVDLIDEESQALFVGVHAVLRGGGASGVRGVVTAHEDHLVAEFQFRAHTESLPGLVDGLEQTYGGRGAGVQVQSL